MNTLHLLTPLIPPLLGGFLLTLLFCVFLSQNPNTKDVKRSTKILYGIIFFTLGVIVGDYWGEPVAFLVLFSMGGFMKLFIKNELPQTS